MQLGARVRAMTDKGLRGLEALLGSSRVQTVSAALWRRMREGTLLRQAAGLAVLLRVTTVLGKRLTFSGYSFDEQWFVWGGWSVLKGLAPYRDFHDFKPPVLFLT